MSETLSAIITDCIDRKALFTLRMSNRHYCALGSADYCPHGAVTITLVKGKYNFYKCQYIGRKVKKEW